MWTCWLGCPASALAYGTIGAPISISVPAASGGAEGSSPDDKLSVPKAGPGPGRGREGHFKILKCPPRILSSALTQCSIKTLYLLSGHMSVCSDNAPWVIMMLASCPLGFARSEATTCCARVNSFRCSRSRTYKARSPTMKLRVEQNTHRWAYNSTKSVSSGWVTSRGIPLGWQW